LRCGKGVDVLDSLRLDAYEILEDVVLGIGYDSIATGTVTEIVQWSGQLKAMISRSLPKKILGGIWRGVSFQSHAAEIGVGT
jgi:hypothetical protein